MNTKLVVIIVLLAFLVIFVLQNADVVSVKILFWDVAVSRALPILATTLVGFAGGYVFARLRPSTPKAEPPKAGTE